MSAITLVEGRLLMMEQQEKAFNGPDVVRFLKLCSAPDPRQAPRDLGRLADTSRQGLVKEFSGRWRSGSGAVRTVARLRPGAQP